MRIIDKTHKMLLAILLGLLAIIFQNVAGPALTTFGGFFPQAAACLSSGLAYVGWSIFRNRETFRGKGRDFWLKSVCGMGVSSAVITICYVASVAAGLPVGVLTAIMGGGMVAAILIRGWKETSGGLRGLLLVSALVTSLGIGIFPLSSSGDIHAMGLFFAALAAGALCTFLVGFHSAAKTAGELHIATGMLLSGVLLVPASAVESLLAGHLKGGEWLDSPSTILMMIALGLAWMGAVNFMNKRAGSRLSGTGFSAIQPLASPIALFTQVVILHQAATVGTYVADALIVAGGLLAFCVELRIQHKPTRTIDWQKDISAEVQLVFDAAVKRERAKLLADSRTVEMIAESVIKDPEIEALVRATAMDSATAEARHDLLEVIARSNQLRGG